MTSAVWSIQIALVLYTSEDLQGTQSHEDLEDDFPFKTGDFQVPSVNFPETNSSPSETWWLANKPFLDLGMCGLFSGVNSLLALENIIYLFGSKAVRGMMKKVRLRDFWSAGMPMSHMLYDSHITSAHTLN